MKMKYYNIIFWIWILQLVTSCNNSSYKKIEEFKKEIRLEGHDVTMQLLFNTPEIYFYDTLYILTMTAPENEKDIYVFSDQFKYIASSGIKGRGPGEIMNPFFATPDVHKKSILIMDQGRNKILEYPVDSILYNKKYLPTSSIKVPSKYPIIVYYSPYNEELFSFLNQFDKGIFISFFDKNGILKNNMNIPDKINLYKKVDYKGYSLLSMYRFSPDKKKIVLAYRFEDAILVFDMQGNVLAKRWNVQKEIQDPNKLILKNTFYKIYTTTKYIYALFLGKNNLDMKENGETTVNYPYTLLVYKWDLTPVVKITFNNSVSSLVIDRKKKRIVTWCPDKGTIVWYKIPECLLN